MDEAIGLTISILFIVALIGLVIALTQGGMHNLRLSSNFARVEDLRSQEVIRTSWIDRNTLLLANVGSLPTRVVYAYLFFGEERPEMVVPLDISLDTGGSRTLNVREILQGEDLTRIYGKLVSCPPGSEGGGSKYYLCPDGYEGNDCDNACFSFSSGDFPQHDRLDEGVSGLSFLKSSDSGEGSSVDLSSLDPVYGQDGYNWSICAWLKVSEAGAGNDRLLAFADRPLQGQQYPDGMFFLYRDARGNVYAVVRWHNQNIVIGRSANADTASDWHFYCITINGTHALFYMDGVLVGAEEGSFADNPTALSWLSYDKVTHSDYWTDEITVAPYTFSLGDILRLYRGLPADIPGSVTWSFDYGSVPSRIDLITRYGNRLIVRWGGGDG